MEVGSIATPTTDGAPAPAGDSPVSNSEAKALALLVAQSADAKKAEDVTILEVTSTLGIADYFVICTATSRKHAQVIAESCRDAAIKAGERPRPLEGAGEASWVCGDFGDVILHVFTDESRRFYDLENLWGDAPRIDFVPAPLAAPER
jgi:ribosome-associated protein